MAGARKYHGEYLIPNTIELASRPEDTRYLWIAWGDDGFYSGSSYGGLTKAITRLGGWELDDVSLKFVDLFEDRVVTIPKRLPIDRLLQVWRNNYFNPDWRLELNTKKKR